MNIGNRLRIIYQMFLLLIADEYIIWKKKISNSSPLSTTDLPSHSIKANRVLWDNYNWSAAGGEEWTNDVKRYRGGNPQEWKNTLINEMMLKYIKKNGTILEIGPGAGRWSKVLHPYASNLILSDISEICLEICKNLFQGATNVQYYLISDRLSMIKENSIDYIWSYDVFVHVNPSEIKKYIEDFYRILKPGGVALIHHSGLYTEKFGRIYGFRSIMDKHTFAQIVRNHGMTIIEQNESLPHKPGDVITVFSKPA